MKNITMGETLDNFHFLDNFHVVYSIRKEDESPQTPVFCFFSPLYLLFLLKKITSSLPWLIYKMSNLNITYILYECTSYICIHISLFRFYSAEIAIGILFLHQVISCINCNGWFEVWFCIFFLFSPARSCLQRP